MQEYCISVVIPVYNCEKHIHRCLKSLVSQDFDGKFEIIIVDDGSTDDTTNVCSALISNMYIPCRLIKQPNLGASAARNTGIREARGEYLIFVDGDDTLELNALKTLYELAALNRTEMVYGSFRRVDENGRLIWLHRPGKKYSGLRSPGEVMEAVLKGKMLLRLGTFIITKCCLLDNGVYFHEGCRYGEDMEFIIRCLLNVAGVYGTEAFIYNYYENPGSVMNKVGLERFEFVEALKRLETCLLKVRNGNRALSDSLFRFYIPYGILFHTDTLLARKKKPNEIFDCLAGKKYDTLLKFPYLPGTDVRVALKAGFLRNKPEAYGKWIFGIKQFKSVIKKHFTGLF